MLPPSRQPTPNEVEDARAFIRRCADAIDYPFVPATGTLAAGAIAAVAARLGVDRTSVSKVWSGARVMPAGWRERALPAQGGAP